LGPNGEPLITRGYATLVFTISGQLFRHEFLVIEGLPMLLLGMDFLAAHSATVSLSNGSTDGVVSLSHPSGVSHSITVSTHPRRFAQQINSANAVGSASAEDDPMPSIEDKPGMPPVIIDFTRDPRQPFDTPLDGQRAVVEGLFDSADRFAQSAPASCSSDYLFYTDGAERIHARSTATLFVNLPKALRDHDKNIALLVTPLPHRKGLPDLPPLVMTRVVAAIEEDGYLLVPVTIVNKSA
jgi:hypothetical protein